MMLQLMLLRISLVREHADHARMLESVSHTVSRSPLAGRSGGRHVKCPSFILVALSL
jgi:hypothetical protein